MSSGSVELTLERVGQYLKSEHFIVVKLNSIPAAQTAVADSWYRAVSEQQPSTITGRDKTQCRVCIVGAGFAGLATAIGLHERGIDDVLVVEAGEIGHGASGRNGGFIFGGYSLSPQALVKQQGLERAREMYQLTTSAVDLIAQRVQKYQINCQYKAAGIMLADWFDKPEVLQQQLEFMNYKMGANWEFYPRSELRQQLNTDRYYDGLLEPGGAHFNPLQYASGLAAYLQTVGIPVWQHSPALEIKPSGKRWQVNVAGTWVETDQVVLACGGYQKILNSPPSSAILPIATYIMVTEPLPEQLPDLIRQPWAVYDTRFAFDYYRPLPDNRLLWGGRISIRDPQPEKIEAMLRRDLTRVFPQLAGVQANYVWSGLMGYPRHQMPMIGQSQPGLWHVTGFGGHGVAPTSALGELVAAAISDNDQRYHWFDDYQLKPVYGQLGMLAAQFSYWQYALRDWWCDPQR